MLGVGIIGLPNVGKSTLFNALLKKQQAFVANYPFTTIEPNVGVVPVPDYRLQALAEIVAKDTEILGYKDINKEDSPNIPVSQYLNIHPIIPATVKFVDIAGLVKGANKGAGLGNKFLSHIREVSIIVHVIRAFEGENVVKEGSVDPKADYETIQTELILADLETISKIKNSSFAKASADKQKSALRLRSGQKEAIEKLFGALNKGIPAREAQLTEEEQELSMQFFLLTAKPEIVVINVSEDSYTKDGIEETLEQQYSRSTVYGNINIIVVCAEIEAELSDLSEGEQKEYLNSLGFKESGLERLIEKAYETLGLISFFTTTGGKEVRAWTVKKGTKALAAAGVIHTDFQKKFVKAEVVSFEDFVEQGGWKGAREKGKTRFEGRDYIVRDGDIIEFKVGS